MPLHDYSNADLVRMQTAPAPRALIAVESDVRDCPKCGSTRLVWLPLSEGWRALWWDYMCDRCGHLWP